MLITAPLHAQQADNTHSSLIETFRTLIREKMQNDHLVGVGAALILSDSVVWKEGFGYADLENKIPFTPQTALSVGSVTKPFTGMGIMLLQEKKLLDINEPLQRCLPEFSIRTRQGDVRAITVKSVMQHTSGLPNDVFLNCWDEHEKYINTVEYVKNEYQGYPVSFAYHYSNIGYCLLGHAILKVSGQEYPNFIQDNILKPVGMNNSGFMGYCTLKNLSKTYDSEGKFTPVKYGRNIPAGGMLSTIDDMVRFAQELIAVYHGKKGSFISPGTLKMFDVTNYDNVQNINTCFGWDVFRNDSCLVVAHGGSHHVAVASLVIDLKKKSAMVIFVNTLGGMNLVSEATDRFFEASGVSNTDLIHPAEYENHEANDVSRDLLKGHAGLYADTRAVNVVTMGEKNLLLNSAYGNFQLASCTRDEFLPGYKNASDSMIWLKKPRFIFEEVMGYKILYWQDGANKRQALGLLEVPGVVSESWKKRLGKYELVGQEIESADRFSEAELSVSENNLMQLKVFYTSGEYVYFLRIENENELVFCGLDLTQGGETVRFSQDGESVKMTIYGLSMLKTAE